MHYHFRTFLFVICCGGVLALWALDIHRRSPQPHASSGDEPGLVSLPVSVSHIQPVSGETLSMSEQPGAEETNKPADPATAAPAKTETKVDEATDGTTASAKTAKPAEKPAALPPPLPTTPPPPLPPKPGILIGSAPAPADAAGKFLLNKMTFDASVTVSKEQYKDASIVFYLNQGATSLAATKTDDEKGIKWVAPITVSYEGEYRVVAAAKIGEGPEVRSLPALVRIRTSGPTVQDVQPQNLAFATGHKTVTVRFNAQNPLDVATKDGMEIKSLKKANFVFKPSTGTALEPAGVDYNPSDNSVTLTYDKEFAADNYTLTVNAGQIMDVYGNTLAAQSRATLFMPVGGEVSTVSRGISGSTGPNVEFSEYTPPRKILSGFNPSDRVETRVSRLYYFRDAHRVAQIINRDVKSYNRAAVDMQQQLADKARNKADEATDARRAKERKAIEAAKKTREAEREQQEAEQAAQSASTLAFQAGQPSPSGEASQVTPEQAKELERAAAAARARAQSAREKVEALRETEIAANEESQAATAVEDRARDNQFRREVAAALCADPDTYAPGKPESQDPVRQVSVSVIGEGLIQLRGPMKGINVIRTMINQMDAPVGQVRISVHTVQINGEKGDRMEKVASKIQRFIDHSRFLTLQSAEMFRKAIVQVAAQKAIQLNDVPGLTQDERDRKYLHAFFGQDFISELEVMDSEFLRTGNKLLSIHSMDSTSLASAMFVMALAKNSTRMEILQTFEGMMHHQLPLAEQNYFEAGYTSDGKQPLFNRDCKPEDFQLLSENARFQSIKGMFDVEINSDDTLTPIQHEFVRLAQIFKSRLIVEMELKQRVMERSVIEERLDDDPKAALNAAKAKEDQARLEAEEANKQTGEQLSKLQATSQVIRGRIELLKSQTRKADAIRNEFDFLKAIAKQRQIDEQSMKNFREKFVAKPDFVAEFEKHVLDFRKNVLYVYPCLEKYSMNRQLYEFMTRFAKNPILLDPEEKRKLNANELEEKVDKIRKEWKLDDVTLTLPNGQTITITINKDYSLSIGVSEQEAIGRRIRDGIRAAEDIRTAISVYKFNYASKERLRQADECLRLAIPKKPNDELDDLSRIGEVLKIYAELADEVLSKTNELGTRFARMLGALSGDHEFGKVFGDWVGLHQEFESSFEPVFLNETKITEMDAGFGTLMQAEVARRASEKNVAASRRPLDHKKFLDMLIDEMEDKYIELLEGTRAHTANIDAYIKRLMTSLDDDFNTQFYYPTFRKVREASQMWDVQMGQVETTNVLANNRSFAKVTPEATMEFDLPKRDILITEAMNGAKAMVQDFGALAQDPTFLSMAKMGSGAPTSTQTGGASGGQSTVRNVLPGMSTDTGESVMGQQGPGGNQFGSALESLIPDPAIYKFETGTGWEIRPVIQPDGQSVVFDFNYLYTANVREPVRADEKHLGRVKRHQVNTDVQLSNFELREISRYTVALKASRTSRGVPLFEDIPVVGVLFRPQPSQESSLQQNVILGQSTIFPTLFDLMGLRWAPVVADLDPLRLSNDEFLVRGRRRALMNRVFDQSSSQVDQFLRIPEGERRMDLYRSQETIPSQHPNGYQGSGANLRDSQLREGYDTRQQPGSQFIPSQSPEGSRYLPGRRDGSTRAGTHQESFEGPALEGPVLEAPSHEPSRPLIPRVHVAPLDGSLEEVPLPPPDMSSRHRETDAPSRIEPVGYFTRTPAASARTETDRPRPRLRRLPPVEPRQLPLPDRARQVR